VAASASGADASKRRRERLGNEAELGRNICGSWF
jgi:hypothetical protein